MKNLGSLIDALGTARFHQDLYETLDELAQVDHLSLLRFDGDQCARLVFSTSRPRWRFRHDAQNAYLECFCALDPNRSVFQALRPGAGVVLRRLRRDEVPGADYRRHCYDAAQLVDRLSVLSVDACGGYALNLYRNGEHGPFSDGEMTEVGDSAAVLAACCAKHDWCAATGSDDDQDAASRVDGIRSCLQRHRASLSARESAVAARVLVGMTSDGIAVDLGIGLQSVLTYRKRAYAKLGVCGQRELLSLFLNWERKAQPLRTGGPGR